MENLRTCCEARPICRISRPRGRAPARVDRAHPSNRPSRDGTAPGNRGQHRRGPCRQTEILLAKNTERTTQSVLGQVRWIRAGRGDAVSEKLSDARRSGNHMYGLIRRTGEGRANSLTPPNPEARAKLLQEVVARTGIDPRTIGIIEAHGTGAELGDPIEINRLKTTIKELSRESGDPRVACPHYGPGSVKTNIEHRTSNENPEPLNPEP